LPKLESSKLIRIALDFPVIQPLLQRIDTEFARRIQTAMRVIDRLNDADCVDLMTPMEMRVLKCLDQGLENRRIAVELYVTYETVLGHLKSIYRKFSVHSSAEALCIARDVGLV